MASIKIRADNTTYTLYGVIKHVTRGGTSYSPSEVVWNDAVKKRCVKSYNGSSQDYYIFASPCMSGAPRNGIKFLSMGMKTGDTCPLAKQYTNVPRMLRCRVDDKTMFPCNNTGTVAVGDTLSWTEEITIGSTNVHFETTTYGNGTLNINCKYYDANNNEITTTTGYSKPTIYMYANGTKIDDETAQGATPSFEVRFSDNGTDSFWYEINNGTYKKWDDFTVASPCRVEISMNSFDSRIKKVKATYTWTWS